MAGDWIKMRTDLPTDPSVIGIAGICGLEEDSVVGKLHRLWSWADAHTSNGNAHSVTEMWIDRYIGVTGFASAMQKVGWLIVKNDGVTFPRFERHNGKTAKRRALTAKRVAAKRAKSGNADGVTKTEQQRYQRREEYKDRSIKSLLFESLKEQIPEELRTESFSGVWDSWVKHREEIKKPLKPTQVKSQLAMLGKLGQAKAIAMIEYTIAKGWQGLAEPDAKSVHHVRQEIEF